jgi:hypothetical protein
MTTTQEIRELTLRLLGLNNDARYWDLRRTYGDHSVEVLRYLRSIATVQAAGRNHT